MQITFDTSTATLEEYAALQALISVLSGRAVVAEEIRQTFSIPDALATEALREIVEDNTDRPAALVEAPNSPEVDANGLPWDERIHSSNRKTIADGTWQKKRGVDAALVASVEAELRGETVEQPVAAMTVEAAFAPPPPPPPAAPVDGYTPDIAGFTKLMTTLTKKQGEGTCPATADLLPTLAGLGLAAGFPDLMKPDNLHLIPTVAATLGF